MINLRKGVCRDGCRREWAEQEWNDGREKSSCDDIVWDRLIEEIHMDMARDKEVKEELYFIAVSGLVDDGWMVECVSVCVTDLKSENGALFILF